MAEAAKQLMTELSDDYDVVVKALGRMTRNIGDHGDEAIADAAQDFVRAASELADRIKNQSATLAQRAGEQIREHPITTAAIAAAAVGLLGYA
ncbi:MAG: hypothetical protein HUU35_16110, partial [Armatimonadetes bacterium]|nr:hypothetical protein [Armatimonadota bacterium]